MQGQNRPRPDSKRTQANDADQATAARLRAVVMQSSRNAEHCEPRGQDEDAVKVGEPKCVDAALDICVIFREREVTLCRK